MADHRGERIFEAMLVVAALLETGHLIGLFGRRAEVDGQALAVIFTLGVPWLVVLLGLALTRYHSRAARVLLILLGLIALVSAIRIGTGRWDEPAILLGALAGILQVAAIAMLLLPVSRGWTGRVAAR